MKWHEIQWTVFKMGDFSFYKTAGHSVLVFKILGVDKNEIWKMRTQKNMKLHENTFLFNKKKDNMIEKAIKSSLILNFLDSIFAGQ